MELVCKLPIAPILKSNIMQDQLLLGQRCEVLDCFDKFYYIKTEYGYTGYIKKTALLKNSKLCEMTPFLINAPFAVVLQRPFLKSALLCSLPKGAVVGFAESSSNGYIKIMLPSGKFGYCKANAIKPVPQPLTKKESALRNSICENALSYLGSQYLWGGKTHLGIDCSGLTFMAYYLEGISIYRDAQLRANFAPKPITLSLAKKGDLLYFKGHVAIYLGNGRFVHSTAFTQHEGVGIASLEPLHKEYRADLASSLYAVGSVF